MDIIGQVGTVRGQQDVVLVPVVGIHLNLRMHKGEDQGVLPLPTVMDLKTITLRSLPQKRHITDTSQCLPAA
ncbi:MAG TPA: hypothetical protein DCY24_00075 [Rikenellaceae bacterium]|nr:hypothetical protein [Rikenellaceae bacterium]